MKNPYANLRATLKRPLFVPFVVVGDPNPAESIGIINTLIANGADALELGFPFSDPTADGATIQAADVRALAAGTTIDDCFGMLRGIRQTSAIPIGLLVYMNIVLKRGIDRFYDDCNTCGITSVLIADLPVEHMDDIADAAKRTGIAQVCIASVLTSDERLTEVLKHASGYLYLVSSPSVTGKTDSVFEKSIAALIARVRTQTDLPLLVGFGIQTASDVTSVVKAGADGVIVGSRIVKEIPDLRKIATTCKELRSALSSQ